MSTRDKDIKQGFSGMDYTKKSQLFEEMPPYKSRSIAKAKRDAAFAEQELKRTRLDNTKDALGHTEALTQHAMDYLNTKHPHLIADLNSSELKHVVSALVEYKAYKK